MGEVEVNVITVAVWKAAPGFVVEIGLKEAQSECGQSGRESACEGWQGLASDGGRRGGHEVGRI